jgi:hypothetical protein
MAKQNRPIRKPLMDPMAPRQSGERGWQLNLREQLLAQTPKHILDLRESTSAKDQAFFEYMQLDALPLRTDTPDEYWQPDELDIDERLTAWWQWAKQTVRLWPAAVLVALSAVPGRLRQVSIWPRRRALGVILAVALLASLGLIIAASQSTQKISQQGVGTPGRGGIALTGALPTTGAGNWLDILVSHFQGGKFLKLSPAAYAQASGQPGLASSILSTGVIAPVGTTSDGSVGSGSGSIPQPISQPAPAPAPVPAPISTPAPVTNPLPLSTPAPVNNPLPVPSVPLQPITQPLQPITQPLQPVTKPLTSPLGL